MAASRAELFRQHALACLLAAPQIPGVGAKVSRAREDKYSDGEDQSVNIKSDGVPKKIFGSTVYDAEQTLKVHIYVRAAQGEIWETKADAINVDVHAKFKAYVSWPAGFVVVDCVDEQFGGDGEDHTPGLLTATYAIRFLSSRMALDAVPNQP